MMMQAGDIRELSFQNVVDQILKPNKVKVGGIPDTIFLDMADEDKETLICNVCFLIVNDARQCTNKHLFCHTCIFAWSMTYGENSQKCPMCRVDQTNYEENEEVNQKLLDKRIVCPEDGCSFKGPLKIFLMHGHGKEKYSNKHVDFESIKPPTRPEGSRLLVLPNLTITGNTPTERARSIRDQLHQGRMMIHQMMLLLNLEMQLRQQAVTSFQQATDPHTRLSRLDEVMALNEQLNEVGTVLSTLLNSPINSIIAANRAVENLTGARSSDRTTSLGSMLAATGSDSPRFDAADDDEDDDSSDSSDDSSIVTRFRRDALSRRVLTSNTNTSSSTNQAQGTNSLNSSDRPLRRSEIRESLLASRSERVNDTSDDIPTISQGRHLPDYSQASLPSTDLHPRVLMGRSQISNRTVTRPSASNGGSSVTLESTQRLGSASANRSSGLQTTINSRNQTLPSLPIADNSSRRTHIITPRNNASDTSRPPSSQPSEADIPDEERPIVPRGSTAFNQTRASIENSVSNTNNSIQTTRSSEPVGRSSTNNNHSSISWHSGTNTGTTPRLNSIARQQPNSVSRGYGSLNINESTITTEQQRRGDPSLVAVTPRIEPQRANQGDTNLTLRQRVPSGTNRRILTRSQETGNSRDTSVTQPARALVARRASNNNNTGLSTENRSHQPRIINNTQNTTQKTKIVTRRRSTSIGRSQINGIAASTTNQVSPPVRPRPPQQAKTTSNQSSSTLSRTGTNRATNNQGPLLRARRRSEIQQDLMKVRSSQNN